MATRDEDGPSKPTYRVGYGRPPEEHRIREGDIRNPWGRRGKPKPATDFLEQLVPIRIDGRSRKITRAEAIDHALYREAMAGKVPAAKLLEARYDRRLAAKAGEPKPEQLTLDQEAALLRFFERTSRASASETDDEGGSGDVTSGGEDRP